MTLQQSTARPSDVLLRGALGTTIRRLRRDRDLSQAQLGKRAGLAHNHIGEIERVPRDMKLQTMVSLAKAFDMRVSELLAQAEKLARDQASEQPRLDSSAAL